MVGGHPTDLKNMANVRIDFCLFKLHLYNLGLTTYEVILCIFTLNQI